MANSPTTLPIRPVVLPGDLADVRNGQLSTSLLTAVGPRGWLHHRAAAAWALLVLAAARDGFALTYTYGGTYRALGDQIALFRQRYTTSNLPGRPVKVWEGVVYSQLPNTAMAAVPGTSNHGWGLAVDTALGTGPDRALSITPRIDWLAEHAPPLGWSWETLPSEPWHIRYVLGDHVPALSTSTSPPASAVRAQPAPDAVEQQPSPASAGPDIGDDDDMAVFLIKSPNHQLAQVAFDGAGCNMIGAESPDDEPGWVARFGTPVPVSDALWLSYEAHKGPAR